ncbi:MAG: S41 family peptidase [Candidatus Limimorpha sp.]
MKKLYFFAILLVFAASISSCRKKADTFPYIGESNKLAYSTYSEQFDFIWKNISTGYVFWDIDDTDWDEIYTTYMPKFQELDSRYAAGENISIMQLNELYSNAMRTFKDHHMAVVIVNLHPVEGESDYCVIIPSDLEVMNRDYYFESMSVARQNILNFLSDVETEMSGYSIIEHETIATTDQNTTNVTYHYFKIRLDDGRIIPYLWQSCAVLTPVMLELGNSSQYGQAAAIVEKWFKTIKETPKEQLAGIILDNRTNNGGYQDDLDLLIGSFIDEEIAPFSVRYKEGPGRLEHSVWMPYTLKPDFRYHRNLANENIPYVVICDINSISMGEIESICITSLPTGYSIGERTFGATGPLYDPTMVNISYSGTFGDQNLNNGHYVYTSTFESKFGDLGILEGKGFTPNKVLLRKDAPGYSFAPQLEAAIEYIRNY